MTNPAPHFFGRISWLLALGILAAGQAVVAAPPKPPKPGPVATTRPGTPAVVASMLPDLTIKKVDFKPIKKYTNADGSTCWAFEVWATMANLGHRAASAWVDHYRQRPEDGVWEWVGHYGASVPARSEKAVFCHVHNNCHMGPYTFREVADEPNQVVESDESNNKLEATYPYTP